MTAGARHSYSLIIPTKDRNYHLGRRLPLWAKMGFDEVIVVDSSRDAVHRAANEQMCRRLGARYIYAQVNRSEARNLGARSATGTWVLFTDDDISSSATFHREVMDDRAGIYDWLKAGSSQEVTIFNRAFFLRIGGYRPNLVLGEDDDLTARAAAEGKGGPFEGVVGPIEFEPDDYELRLDFKRRLTNYIEYSFTLWEYAREGSERPAKRVLSWCLEILRTGRRALGGEMRAVPYFLGAVGGLTFGFLSSPIRRSRTRKGDSTRP